MAANDTIESVPLTVAAQRLGMSWERVWRRVLNGDLHGEKVGGRWLVSTESLDAVERELKARG